ncbi:MAG: hypothetical protein JNL82_37095 [Myxococcales bacterium]|nr:hypothetical protein [Myxococcales bacterium]
MSKQPDQAPSVPALPRGLTRRSLVVALAASVALGGVTACGAPGNDRWVVTENTTVEIDWDAINQAYRDAEGPEDFEQKVNEIYTGDEIISISVRDADDKSQVVTGFFDKDGDGKVSEPEKIFTIQRDLVGADKAQYQIAGYGPYHGYHSPMWDIASGMMMGMFLSSMFSPGYRPMYVTPYTTSPARQAALSQHRSSYRAANPGKFAKSSSGRSYGNRGGAWGSGGSGRRRSGGSFGVRRPAARRVVGLV